ncbi:hypothetical protein PG990_009507 [Apiospora arundinis]
MVFQELSGDEQALVDVLDQPPHIFLPVRKRVDPSSSRLTGHLCHILDEDLGETFGLIIKNSVIGLSLSEQFLFDHLSSSAEERLQAQNISRPFQTNIERYLGYVLGDISEAVRIEHSCEEDRQKYLETFPHITRQLVKNYIESDLEGLKAEIFNEDSCYFLKGLWLVHTRKDIESWAPLFDPFRLDTLSRRTPEDLTSEELRLWTDLDGPFNNRKRASRRSKAAKNSLGHVMHEILFSDLDVRRRIKQGILEGGIFVKKPAQMDGTLCSTVNSDSKKGIPELNRYEKRLIEALDRPLDFRKKTEKRGLSDSPTPLEEFLHQSLHKSPEERERVKAGIQTGLIRNQTYLKEREPHEPEEVLGAKLQITPWAYFSRARLTKVDIPSKIETVILEAFHFQEENDIIEVKRKIADILTQEGQPQGTTPNMPPSGDTKQAEPESKCPFPNQNFWYGADLDEIAGNHEEHHTALIEAANGRPNKTYLMPPTNTFKGPGGKTRTWKRAMVGFHEMNGVVNSEKVLDDYRNYWLFLIGACAPQPWVDESKFWKNCAETGLDLHPSSAPAYSRTSSSLDDIIQSGKLHNWTDGANIPYKLPNETDVEFLRCLGNSKGLGYLPASILNRLRDAGLIWIVIPPELRVIPLCWKKTADRAGLEYRQAVSYRATRESLESEIASKNRDTLNKRPKSSQASSQISGSTSSTPLEHHVEDEGGRHVAASEAQGGVQERVRTLEEVVGLEDQDKRNITIQEEIKVVSRNLKDLGSKVNKAISDAHRYFDKTKTIESTIGKQGTGSPLSGTVVGSIGIMTDDIQELKAIGARVPQRVASEEVMLKFQDQLEKAQAKIQDRMDAVLEESKSAKEELQTLKIQAATLQSEVEKLGKLQPEDLAKQNEALSIHVNNLISIADDCGKALKRVTDIRSEMEKVFGESKDIPATVKQAIRLELQNGYLLTKEERLKLEERVRILEKRPEFTGAEIKALSEVAKDINAGARFTAEDKTKCQQQGQASETRDSQLQQQLDELKQKFDKQQDTIGKQQDIINKQQDTTTALMSAMARAKIPVDLQGHLGQLSLPRSWWRKEPERRSAKGGYQ